MHRVLQLLDQIVQDRLTISNDGVSRLQCLRNEVQLVVSNENDRTAVFWKHAIDLMNGIVRGTIKWQDELDEELPVLDPSCSLQQPPCVDEITSVIRDAIEEIHSHDVQSEYADASLWSKAYGENRAPWTYYSLGRGKLPKQAGSAAIGDWESHLL